MCGRASRDICVVMMGRGARWEKKGVVGVSLVLVMTRNKLMPVLDVDVLANSELVLVFDEVRKAGYLIATPVDRGFWVPGLL